ncbi:MAG: hypothetical protein R3F55_13795 [Alphaproteobacteria bacterium]
MPVPSLRFETTWSFPFPVTTTGAATGLTICLRNGDPYLAFLTQTGFDDDVVYLHTFGGDEAFRHVSPVGYETISGMAYDPFRRVIWACQATNDVDTILAFDPTDGLLTATRLALTTAGLYRPEGLACNGFFFVRGGGATAELWATNGLLLGVRDYPGRSISGLSASPWSYCFVDRQNDEIVVIGPLGNEIAVSSGVGAKQGMESIAFDYLGFRDMEHIPQVWAENGTIGDPGTIYHPDTPWDPEPFGGRHRLYIANEVDQTIYAGYLTAQ